MAGRFLRQGAGKLPVGINIASFMITSYVFARCVIYCMCI